MKNIISYSLHVGKGENRIINKNNLMKTMFHNLRYYTKQNLENKIYDKDNVYILKGTKDLFNDVKDLYFDEFESVRIDYNNKQKRKDRKIEDYFEYINNNDQKDLAVEMMIQIGHKDFYDKYGFKDKKDEFVKLFQKEIEKLETHLPNFKIANAVIHFDEASPHIQIVGIPIANNLKRGMSKQISKSEVFNKESLIKLQELMRIGVEDDFKKIYGNVSLKPREKGRNHDFTVKEYGRLMDQVKDKYNESIQNIENGIKNRTNELSNINSKIEDKKDELNNIKSQINTKNNELNTELNKIETKIDSKNNELKLIDNEIYVKNTRLSSINTNLDNKNKELDNIKEQIINNTNVNNDLLLQIERSKDQINQLNNLREEENEIKEKISQLNKNFESEFSKRINNLKDDTIEEFKKQADMFYNLENKYMSLFCEEELFEIVNKYDSKKMEILENKDENIYNNIIPKLPKLLENLFNYIKTGLQAINQNYYYK